MDEALKAKLDEARTLMNTQQAGINANRGHEDTAIREWARGKQGPTNKKRAQFRASLTDKDRSRMEERIDRLRLDHPSLSPVNVRALEPKPDPPPVPAQGLGESYFPRDIMVGKLFVG